MAKRVKKRRTWMMKPHRTNSFVMQRRTPTITVVGKNMADYDFC